MKHGQGTWTYPDGTKYTGETNNKGQHHGQGTLTYADGTTYTGKFKDGKPVP